MGCSFVLSLTFSWEGSFCSSREPGPVSSAASVFHLFPPHLSLLRTGGWRIPNTWPIVGGCAQTLGGREAEASGTAAHLVQNFPVAHFHSPPAPHPLPVLLPPDMLDSLFVLCDWQCGPINLTGIVTTCAFSFAARLTRPEGPERLENGEQREHNTEMWGANLGCLLMMRKLC